MGSFERCFQNEECMTILKKLSSEEAECVIQRLTTWARLQLEDKRHISDEVGSGGLYLLSYCIFIIFLFYTKYTTGKKTSNITQTTNNGKNLYSHQYYPQYLITLPFHLIS